MNLNNRWFQLVAGLITMIMIANFQYAWILFSGPVKDGTGWSVSAIGLAFTIFISCQAFAQPASGYLIDRLGPRIFFTVAGLMCGLGWAGLGVTKSQPMFYLLYGMTGVGAAVVYGGCVGSALKWFHDKRGLAAGIMAAGFGGGAALFNPVILQVIKSRGYETAFIWTGLFQGLMIVLAAQVLRHPPFSAAAATRAVGKSTTQAERHNFTTGEMLKNPTFYYLYLMFVLMATGGLVLTGQAGLVSRSWGISVRALGWVAFGGPIMNTLSRTGFGWLSDRLGRELTMGIAFTLNGAALLATIMFGSLSDSWFIFTMLLSFVTWGEMYSLFPATLGDYFGTRYASGNYGLLYTGKGVASFIGGVLAGMMFDKFGTWSAVFASSAAMALISGLMAFGLRSMIAARVARPAAAMSPAAVK